MEENVFVPSIGTVLCQVFKNHSGIHKDVKEVGQGFQITNTPSFYLLFCLQSKIDNTSDTTYEPKPDVPSDPQTVTSTVVPPFLPQSLALYLLFHRGFSPPLIPFSVHLLHTRTWGYWVHIPLRTPQWVRRGGEGDPSSVQSEHAPSHRSSSSNCRTW